MSDYVHEQCILHPIIINYEEEYDEIETKLLDAQHAGEMKNFEIDCFYDDEAAYFLKYVLHNTYGESAGDWGASRFLNEGVEKKFWTEKFEQAMKLIGREVEPDKLKYCDYCYYNCCEAPDYYNHNGLNVDTVEMYYNLR